MKLPLALTTHGELLEANCCNARLMSIHLEGSDGLICTPLFTNLLHSLEHFQGYLTCQNWSLEQFFWHLHGLFDLQSISWGKMGLILGYFDPRRYVLRCGIHEHQHLNLFLPSAVGEIFNLWNTYLCQFYLLAFVKAKSALTGINTVIFCLLVTMAISNQGI
jgi:hypothetical protein